MPAHSSARKVVQGRTGEGSSSLMPILAPSYVPTTPAVRLGPPGKKATGAGGLVIASKWEQDGDGGAP